MTADILGSASYISIISPVVNFQALCLQGTVIAFEGACGACGTGQGGNAPLLPTGTLELQGNSTPTMEKISCDPKIAELLNTKLGKYLSEHPFLAMVLLVFAVTSAVPIGLFLIFAAVTSIAVTVCFVFAELFLLVIGGATLLCVLFCLVVVAFWVSCLLSASYVITSHVLNFCSIRMPEQTISAGDMEAKNN